MCIGNQWSLHHIIVANVLVELNLQNWVLGDLACSYLMAILKPLDLHQAIISSLEKLLT